MRVLRAGACARLRAVRAARSAKNHKPAPCVGYGNQSGIVVILYWTFTLDSETNTCQRLHVGIAGVEGGGGRVGEVEGRRVRGGRAGGVGVGEDCSHGTGRSYLAGHEELGPLGSSAGMGSGTGLTGLPRFRAAALRGLGMPDVADGRAVIIVHRCTMLGSVHGGTGCNSVPETSSPPDRNKPMVRQCKACKNKT